MPASTRQACARALSPSCAWTLPRRSARSRKHLCDQRLHRLNQLLVWRSRKIPAGCLAEVRVDRRLSLCHHRRRHRAPGPGARAPDSHDHPLGRQGGHHPAGAAHCPGDRPGHQRTHQRAGLPGRGRAAGGPARRRIVRKAARRAGIAKAVTPHTLRHVLSALFSCSDSRHRRASGPAACAVRLPPPRCRLLRNHVKRVSLPAEHANCDTGTSAHGECGQKSHVHYRRARCRGPAARRPGGCLRRYGPGQP